ncbi:hypothetical protein BDP81DRAFT_455275 [Colletotrichum phormii]|uniref:F-box domain-containing protein n=1 Tax=Colletotrichum phormii TaxID=359342 RepID=A0AAJ0E974_9PEZI|nr:uncharacterized protein BDP81DRAFT_455275 [Colletotrichum phormii]KAK1622470.1 hypothetical protein BDP81DRAFT_455275 [Colletotrichum phormii]
METLPQDLIDDIVSYLLPQQQVKAIQPYDVRVRPISPVAPLATVSRRLQAAVERATFRSLKITSDEFPKFIEILTPARRYHLASLIVTITLPPYDEAASHRAESPEERLINDKCYSNGIKSLFDILRRWEDEDPETIGYRLALFINHPESPSDTPWPTKYVPWGEMYPEEDGIYEGRFLHSFIELRESQLLPNLERVKQLVMMQQEERYGHRNTYPKVPIILASKMPNLERFKLFMNDDEKRFEELRILNRNEAAQAIRELSLPSLRKAEFDFFQRRYRNERAMPPALHGPGVPDPLSSAICAFSQNLVDLSVTGAFDDSLLRPTQGLSETSWPNLRFLDVNMHATSPSGTWYFKKADGSPDHRPYTHSSSTNNAHSDLHSEEFSFVEEAAYARMTPVEVFRCKPDDAYITPFIEAYANALKVMPKLASAALNFQLEYETEEDEPSWMCIAYFAPCRTASKHPPKLLCPNCNRGVTRQLVKLYLGWEPSEALAAKLRAIGDEAHEASMVEKTMAQFMDQHEWANNDDL